ncbi:MAG: hypothetical protein AAF995_04695 [Planctomycetota bacterium]
MRRRFGVQKRWASIFAALLCAHGAVAQDLVLPEAPTREGAVAQPHPAFAAQAAMLREEADLLEQRGARRAALRVALRRLAAGLLQTPPVDGDAWRVILTARTIAGRSSELDAAIAGTGVDDARLAQAALSIEDLLDSPGASPDNSPGNSRAVSPDVLDRGLRDALAPLVRGLPVGVLATGEALDVQRVLEPFLQASGAQRPGVEAVGELLGIGAEDAAYRASAARVLRVLGSASRLLRPGPGVEALPPGVADELVRAVVAVRGEDPPAALALLEGFALGADVSEALVGEPGAGLGVGAALLQLVEGEATALPRLRLALRLAHAGGDEPAADVGALRQLEPARSALLDGYTQQRGRARTSAVRVLLDNTLLADPGVLALDRAVRSAAGDVGLIETLDARLRETGGGAVRAPYRRLAGRLGAITRENPDALLELARQARWIIDMPGEDELAASLSRSAGAPVIGPVGALAAGGGGEPAIEQVESLARLLREARAAWVDAWVGLNRPDAGVMAGLGAIRSLLAGAGDVRAARALDERTLSASRYWQLEAGAIDEATRPAELTLSAQFRALLDRDAGRASRLATTADEQLALARAALAVREHAGETPGHVLGELAAGPADVLGDGLAPHAGALAELCGLVSAARSSVPGGPDPAEAQRRVIALAEAIAEALRGGG